MKEIFEELEAEVDQNVVNRKFTKMHDAHTVVQARCLKLEAELSKLNDKIQKDDHNELVKRFSNLEFLHLVCMLSMLNQSPLRNRNNREVHLDYLKHLKESVETLREIVEEAKVERPLDRSLASACLYTKHSQELLEYVIGTCPKDFNKRDKKHASTPLTRKNKLLLRTNVKHQIISHTKCREMNIRANVLWIPSSESKQLH
ncbi:hypothetical protein Tco_0942823 [Tanacetum coccineum]